MFRDMMRQGWTRVSVRASALLIAICLTATISFRLGRIWKTPPLIEIEYVHVLDAPQLKASDYEQANQEIQNLIDDRLPQAFCDVFSSPSTKDLIVC